MLRSMFTIKTELIGQDTGTSLHSEISHPQSVSLLFLFDRLGQNFALSVALARYDRAIVGFWLDFGQLRCDVQTAHSS